MVADRVLERIPELKRHEFCIGNIAPDCNVENADWTAFIPSREVTHWMSSGRKTAGDSERFYVEYLEKRKKDGAAEEELSFLLGYYAHLVVDAEFQRMIRDEERVAAMWERIQKHPVLKEQTAGLPLTWDSAKKRISKEERNRDTDTLEAEYLEKHPDSGYLTEVMGLTYFPDYLDFFPKGAIVRKVGVMGTLPQKRPGEFSFVAVSREEYAAFVESSCELVLRGILR
ncbi:MAG: zinc dependent phospholipase C family protein [Clostridia bacterium]|nr:zinc dependent phospholipase C family protein [Clostridia bacterium]